MDIQSEDLAEVVAVVMQELEGAYRDRLLALERQNDRLIGELNDLRARCATPAPTG